jgi:hypothetical protein
VTEGVLRTMVLGTMGGVGCHHGYKMPKVQMEWKHSEGIGPSRVHPSHGIARHMISRAAWYAPNLNSLQK